MGRLHKTIQPLEKTIEAKVVKWAKSKDFMVYKMNGMGTRSWPDRLFIAPNGTHIYIEFKRLGGVLSAGQEDMIEQLTKQHCHVFVYYNSEDAIGVLESFL